MATAVETPPETDIDTDQTEGQDADRGKLFDIPRVGILIDETDPTVIRLAFSGKIDLDRTIASDVETYNALKAGQTRTLNLDVHVAGAKTTHRRDGEGDVDAIVQTKSLVVHSLNSTE